MVGQKGSIFGTVSRSGIGQKGSIFGTLFRPAWDTTVSPPEGPTVEPVMSESWAFDGGRVK